MRTTLIFDFDGVLVDSLKPMLSNAGQVCRELGYPCQPSQADLEALDRMEFSEFGRQLGIPEEKIGAFVSRNFELFSLREEPLEITPGIDSVIRGLSTSAFLALITGNSCAVVRKFLDAHGMEHEFQKILGAEDEGNRVDKIRKIISIYGHSGGEVYMIGDAVSDIRAARETGIKSIAVGWGHQSKEKLLAEFPDIIVDQPQDLLTLFSD